jgi:aminoglycoside phosphotransferase (APT) family kinase protein
MPTTADYDADEVAARLQPWLAERLEGDVEITSLAAPGESGFSSETMLVDLESGGATHRLVVKSRPMGFMVFPSYEMEWQYRCMQVVGSASDVPVPTMRWYESDPGVLGREFYVMDRVEGDVPTDNPPYTIGGFLYEADDEDQAMLFSRSIEVLAELHALDWKGLGLDFLDRRELGTAGLEQQLAYYEAYLPFAKQGDPNQPLDETFAWLRANVPDHTDLALNWGDSRIGNVMYRDYVPVAVLDWEMATLGPPEVDVAWFLYFIRFWSDGIGLPQLPGFPSTDEGARLYEEASGHTLRALPWYTAWAGFRFGAIMVRLFHRMTAEGTMPEGWTYEDNAMIQLMLEVRREAERAAER